MIDFDRVKRDVVGRWDGIFAALGIEVGDGRHTACPICGGKDRFRYDNKEGRGTWYCSQCEPHSGDGWAMVQNVLGVGFVDAMNEVGKIVGSIEVSNIPKKEDASTREYLRKLFETSVEANESNLAGVYLQSRGLSVVPQTLRLSKVCYEPETKKEQLAMLALFHLPDGKAATMHRTFLSQDGDKLNIEKPKKILPPVYKMSGGAVRLFEYDGGILGITEGIETAIAVHEDTQLPVWAALSTTLMEAFEPPREVKHVAIFADNDRNFAGQKAAYRLANKLMTKKTPVIAEVFVPTHPGDDWLDDLNRRAAQRSNRQG